MQIQTNEKNSGNNFVEIVEIIKYFPTFAH